MQKTRQSSFCGKPELWPQQSVTWAASNVRMSQPHWRATFRIVTFRKCSYCYICLGNVRLTCLWQKRVQHASCCTYPVRGTQSCESLRVFCGPDSISWGVGGLHPPGLSDSVFSRSHFIFCRWSDSVGVIKQHRPAYSGVSATLGIKHNISKSASLSERVEYPREFVNEVFMSDGGSVELTD